MSIQEVCRLCLSKDNLVWVFDKRLERADHMKDVILITTGVEVYSKDVISQKICTKCGQDVIKMFQFRQQSLKNDRYLKAQCRDLLKHTDLKIPNTNVTIKTERANKEEIKQETLCRRPTYKVHPTMRALSRKYPQMQFPSICLSSNVDPCISMEMDIVEDYFKSRNLNMRKYVMVALRSSDNPKKSPTITNSSEKITENSAKNRITDHVAHSTSPAISKTVGTTEIIHKVSPINIKLNQSGYSIVRPSNICESTSLCEQLTTYSPESQLGISGSKRRRLSGNEFLSESQTNTTPVQPIVEKISLPVFKCNICSSVQFSAKHLKKHQIRHSRCKFCKTQFKSIGMKQQHIINSCLVKEALNRMPNVEVERVELNRNVRLHHQDAFTIFPPLPGMEKMESSSKYTNAAEEVIEIISDDESTLPMKPNCSRNSAPTTSAVTTTLHKNSASLTVIRPDIRIKNDTVLDSITAEDSELGVVKELLTKLRELQSVAEATQTELPTTEMIQVNEEKCTTELKELKHVLYSYQIPVNIQKGPMNASYNYQSIPSRSKKLSLWNDLTPIDFYTENNLSSNQFTNSEHMITETQPHNNKSCHSFNNGHASLPNIGIVTSTSSNLSAPSSDLPQTKHPTISTRIESLISTPECFPIVQAESLTISNQPSFDRKIQKGNKLSDSLHSIPKSLEIFAVQATSPISDIPIRRHSPDSLRTDQFTPYSNSHSLEIFSEPATSSIADTLDGRNSSGGRTTSQSSAFIINSESFRKSPVQNKSDVNANWNSLNDQAETMDCSMITRRDLTDKAIEYVFNNSSESIDTGTINGPPSNGVIYSSSNQQPRISQSHTPKSKFSHNFPKDPKFHNISFPNIANSSIGSQELHSNDAPTQRVALTDLFIKPPPPYPRGSISVNQASQSYILSHTSPSNVPHPVDSLQTSGYYNAYNEYIAQRQEFRSPMVRVAGTYKRKAVLDAVAHCGKIGYFPASNLLRKSTGNHLIPRSPRISEPSYCHVIKSSVTFPQYSKTSNCANSTSVIVNPVNQNCDASNIRVPITCSKSSTLAACDTLTDSALSSDKSKHFTSGLIRVRNVCEMT